MADTFDAYEYARFLRVHWRLIAASSLAAAGIAFGVSWFLPAKYTATAKVLIESPAGADQRGATAVSPIYLESLRTYEHFASSDSLFLAAIERFRLRASKPRASVESLKKSVLRVELPRNTRILEIRATLPDPKTARDLALFVAEETVKLNRKVNREAEQEVAADIRKQAEDARARAAAAEAERTALAVSAPVDGLEREIESSEKVRAEVEQNLMAAEMLIAEDTGREAHLRAAGGPQLETVREELRLARARADQLRARSAALGKQIEARRKILAERSARLEALDDRVKTARAAAEALETRLQQTLAAGGQRTERLEIIDPGIVPERPSAPRLPLNVIAALLLGLTAGVLYVTLAFGFRRREIESLRESVRAARRGP